MRGVAPSSVVATMRLWAKWTNMGKDNARFSEAGFSGLVQLRVKSQSRDRDLDASY